MGLMYLKKDLLEFCVNLTDKIQDKVGNLQKML